MNVAIQNHDFLVCNNIKSYTDLGDRGSPKGEVREMCYSRVASTLKDSRGCELMPDKAQLGGLQDTWFTTKIACFKEADPAELPVALCDLYLDETLQCSSCYDASARERARDQCYSSAAQAKRNPALCEGIKASSYPIYGEHPIVECRVKSSQ